MPQYKIKIKEGRLLYIKHYVSVLVAQLCPTLQDPMDHSLPGSSVHGILQAQILEWVAISFSRDETRWKDLKSHYAT